MRFARPVVVLLLVTPSSAESSLSNLERDELRARLEEEVESECDVGGFWSWCVRDTFGALLPACMCARDMRRFRDLRLSTDVAVTTIEGTGDMICAGSCIGTSGNVYPEDFPCDKL